MPDQTPEVRQRLGLLLAWFSVWHWPRAVIAEHKDVVGGHEPVAGSLQQRHYGFEVEMIIISVEIAKGRNAGGWGAPIPFEQGEAGTLIVIVGLSRRDQIALMRG